MYADVGKINAETYRTMPAFPSYVPALKNSRQIRLLPRRFCNPGAKKAQKLILILGKKMTVVENQIVFLEKELDHLYRRRNSVRVEIAKSYADAFLRKLEADGIPLKVGLQAVRDLAKLNPPL